MSNTLEKHHRVDMPGMYVFFTTVSSEYYSKPPLLINGVSHTHCCYEISFFSRNGKDVCTIAPPFCQHSSVPLPAGERQSFMFVLTGGKPDRICEVFSKIETTVEIEDDFGGRKHFEAVRALASDTGFGAKELMAAEVRIVIVKLAKALSCGAFEQNPIKQTLEEERESRLESFFASAAKDPNCSKLQLADELGVSERQLTRILQELYGKNYHDLVLASRMRLARALLEKGESIDGVMAKSGYVSRRTFERAYKKYFGHSITKNDMDREIDR